MQHPRRLSSLLTLVMALALVLAGCGDDSGGAEATTTAPPTTQASSGGGGTTTQAPTTEASSGTTAPTSSGSGGSSATVMIGGDTYQFDDSGPVSACNTDFFGGVQVALSMPGLAGSLVLVLPADNWPELGIDDPASVQVSVNETDQDWFADESQYENIADLPEGSSAVTSWQVDGNSVSGEGIFFDRNSYFASIGGAGELDVQTGTFQVTCAG